MGTPTGWEPQPDGKPNRLFPPVDRSWEAAVTPVWFAGITNPGLSRFRSTRLTSPSPWLLERCGRLLVSIASPPAVPRGTGPLLPLPYLFVTAVSFAGPRGCFAPPGARRADHRSLRSGLGPRLLGIPILAIFVQRILSISRQLRRFPARTATPHWPRPSTSGARFNRGRPKRTRRLDASPGESR
jgi:hypothetical protein